MIRVEALTKTYEDGTQAVDSLDLSVEPGELYALLGSNGAGKSTTIHVLLGLVPPTSGRVTIAGADVTSAEAKRHVGYVPEQVALYDDLDGRENCRFFARLAGHDPSLAACAEALVGAGFPEAALKRPVRQLSKGMRQKVAIASIVMRKARVLLLDEPTSGLDPAAAADFLALVSRLRDEGAAILMTTHDLLRMRTVADKVGIMKGGRRVLERTRAELAEDDLLALYLAYAGADPGDHDVGS